MKQPPTEKQKRTDRQLHQKAFLEAYATNFYNISAACKAAKTHRSNYYRWLKEDPEFAEAVDILREQKIDFIESKLMEKINAGNIIAIIFALKCIGKDRGYVEEQRISVGRSINTFSKEEIDAAVAAGINNEFDALIPPAPKNQEPIDVTPEPE